MQFDTGSMNSTPTQLVWNDDNTTVSYWEELQSVLLVRYINKNF